VGQEDVQDVQGVQNNECFGLNIFFGAESNSIAAGTKSIRKNVSFVFD
jgi:hypothetical protein